MEDHRLIQILRELPREHPPEGFTAAVLARSAAESAEPASTWREESRRPAHEGLRFTPWSASSAFATAVAATAVVAIGGLLAAGLLTSRPTRRVSPPPTEVAASGERRSPDVPDQGVERGGGPADHQPETPAMVGIAGNVAPAGSGPLAAGEAQILLRQLSGEQHQLARELRELREPSPVIFLGGTERTEVVFDLRRARFASPAGRVAPAAAERRPDPERL